MKGIVQRNDLVVDRTLQLVQIAHAWPDELARCENAGVDGEMEACGHLQGASEEALAISVLTRCQPLRVQSGQAQRQQCRARQQLIQRSC